MGLIRHRMPGQTRIVPHQANRRILIPNRFLTTDLPPLLVPSVVYTTLTATITFDKPVINSRVADWAATVNALANVVVSAVATGAVVVVTWTTPGVSTNAVIIDYTQGTLQGVLPGTLVKTFQDVGVIP